jgi:hypothetical protein
MSLEAPLTEVELANGELRGSHLALYPACLVHRGGDVTETIPLAQLASVRIAFERDGRELGWGLSLLAGALLLALASAPLQRALGGAMARTGDPVRTESLDAFLHAVFNFLAALASLLPGVGGALALLAAFLLVNYWRGSTSLTLAFAATERVFPVHGRHLPLMHFGEAVAEQIAAAPRATSRGGPGA